MKKFILLFLLTACLVVIINIYKTNKKKIDDFQNIINVEVVAAAKATGLNFNEAHNVHTAVKTFLHDSGLDKFHADNMAAATAPIKVYAYDAAQAYANAKTTGKSDDYAYDKAYSAASDARKAFLKDSMDKHIIDSYYIAAKAAGKSDDEAYVTAVTDKAIADFYYNAAKAAGKSDDEAYDYSEGKLVGETFGEALTNVELDVLIETAAAATGKHDIETILKAHSDTYRRAYADAKDTGMSKADAFITANAVYYANTTFPNVIIYNIAKNADNAAKDAKTFGKNIDTIYVNAEAGIRAAREAFVNAYTPIYLKAYADAINIEGKSDDDANVAAKTAGETYAAARAAGETIVEELKMQVEMEVFAKAFEDARAAKKNSNEISATVNAVMASTREAFVNAFVTIYLKAYREAKAAGKNATEAAIDAKAATETARETFIKSNENAGASARANIITDGKSYEEIFDAMIAADQAAAELVREDFLRTYSIP